MLMKRQVVSEESKPIARYRAYLQLTENTAVNKKLGASAKKRGNNKLPDTFSILLKINEIKN